MNEVDQTPAAFRVIVLVWERTREQPEATMIEAILHELFRVTGALPRISEFRGDSHQAALAFASRPLTDAHRAWIKENWHARVSHTLLGREFSVPVEISPALEPPRRHH